MKLTQVCGLLFMALPFSLAAAAQQRPERPVPDDLGLSRGSTSGSAGDFQVKFGAASGTLTGLQPKTAGGFDFTPSDRLDRRRANGFYHLGDIILRTRTAGGEWKEYDTAKQRRDIRALPSSGQVLAAADLSPTLPQECPLQVTRAWSAEDGAGSALTLRFTLKNAFSAPVEIGGLSIPMVFNNHITGRSLKEAHEVCSFFDPYIGQDAGYLQVTRLSGQGPALVVAPDGATPFEAWTPLEERMRPNQTFEGTFAWVVHSKAYVEKEWSRADPWNPPTSATLAPGESRTYGVRFLLSPDIRSIDRTLARHGRPETVAVPGCILPQDVEGKLFLRYGKPVSRLEVEPKGAIEIRRAGAPTTAARTATRMRPGAEPRAFEAYTLRAKGWGRARVTVTYADNTRHTIHYYLTKPATQVVKDLGRFLTTKQWFDDPSDPFRRSPSVMSYDREANRLVTQDSRVWIAGLGDEAGSGSWLAAVMKQIVQPDPAEVAKLERFVQEVLWGGLQYSEGPNRYGVRKSLFFYDPKEMPGFVYDSQRDWRSWTSWNKQHSMDIGRGYNYPHVVAAYWALYRVKRTGVPAFEHRGAEAQRVSQSPKLNAQPSTLNARPWSWYLNQAHETTKFAFSRDERGRRRVGYVELGLMGGTVFLALLEDLKREGWTEKAAEIEKLMKERAERWSREEYPFGSEMAWDSTGQEEVYAWCRLFGYDDKAMVSLNSILGYMPVAPHWGYSGNARRYWDFLYGGKLSRIERQLHHYGSGLNALPVLAEYRRKPYDFYLLRVGYAGMMGALTNIDQEGFASAAFHSFPATLKWDAYSGDYGPNFLGHALNTGTYIVNHPELGWLAYGGNLKQTGERVRVEPKDSMRQRVFAAPFGLLVTLDEGRLDAVSLDTKTRTIRLALRGNGVARVRVDEHFIPTRAMKRERGAYLVALKDGTGWAEFKRRKNPNDDHHDHDE